MTRPKNRHRRGIFLVNMIMTIGLLTGFAIVAERLFRLSMTTTWSTTRAHDESTRLAQAIGVLRDDAWRAESVERRGPSEIVLTNGGRQVVTWKTDAKTGDVLRVDQDNERRWVGLGFAFDVQAGDLLSVSRKGGEVALLRQAVRSTGGAR